ncbi:MAG: hypothetical protein MH204_08505, partial [Fimbriimonadaceae bacterium]|nr:hypothetical protein [Fimbriimonadaceae bacterium]
MSAETRIVGPWPAVSLPDPHVPTRPTEVLPSAAFDRSGGMTRLAGRELWWNGDLASGLAGFMVYDNAATGALSLSLVTEAPTEPNPSPNPYGRFMRITHSGAPGVVPDLGGFRFSGLLGTGAAAGGYRPGSRLIVEVWARIPVGLSLSFGANGSGTGFAQTWLTSQAGTGAWACYRVALRIGSGANLTSASQGFWFLTGPLAPHQWDVATVRVFAVDEPSSVFHAGRLNVGGVLDIPLENGELATRGRALLALGAGNVGIGTENPSAELDVQSPGIGTGLAFRVRNSSLTQLLAIRDDGAWRIGAGALSATQSGYAAFASPAILRTLNTATASTQQVAQCLG